MAPPHHDADVSEPPIRGENLVISLKSFWALIVATAAVGGFVLRLGFQVSALQDGLLAVNQKLTELNRVAALEAKVEGLKENGSDAVKNLALELAKVRHDFDVYAAEHRKPIQ